MCIGYVYVLMNRGLQQGYFKVGMTTKDPANRANELSTATGVPMPYEVVYHERVADCNQAERLVHERLARHRVSSNKEFFQADLKSVIDAIQWAADAVGRVVDREVETSGTKSSAGIVTSETTDKEIEIVPPGKPNASWKKKSKKQESYLRFWDRLLSDIREKTRRFDHIRPTTYEFVRMIPGPVSGAYYYFLLNNQSIRTELFFDSDASAAFYDNLEHNRPAIDQQCPVSLEWRRNAKTAVVRYVFAHGSFRNEQDWDALMGPALDSLLLLERSLAPYQ